MKCGMIYRRVTEVMEIDQPTIPGLPNYWSQRPSFGRSGFHNQPPKIGPFLKRKRSMESWEELSLSEEVRSFKRVRILSSIKKTRKAAFASWEEKASWSVTESDQIDTVTGDDRFGAKSSSTAEIDANFRNFPPESIILSGATFFPSNEDKQPGERVPTHTLDSEEDKTSCSKDNVLDSAEADDCLRKQPLGLETFMEANRSGPQYNEYSPNSASGRGYAAPPQSLVNTYVGREPGLLEIPAEREIELPGSNDENFMSLGIRPERYARKLSATRALLLECLPGGPILAPISEPNSVILEIGPLNVWPNMGKLIARGKSTSHVVARGLKDLDFYNAPSNSFSTPQPFGTFPGHNFRVCENGTFPEYMIF